MLIEIRGLDSNFWNVVGNNTLEHLAHKNLIWSNLRLSAEHVLNTLGVSANNFYPKRLTVDIHSVFTLAATELSRASPCKPKANSQKQKPP